LLAFAFLISSRPQIWERVHPGRSFLERRQRAIHARVPETADGRGGARRLSAGKRDSLCQGHQPVPATAGRCRCRLQHKPAGGSRSGIELVAAPKL